MLGRMAESQINMTPECLVCWRIFRKPGDVTKERIPTAFYEIRHRAETGARCNLGVPDVVLPADLGTFDVGTSCGKPPDVVHRLRVLSMSHKCTRERVRQGFHIPGSSLITRGVDPSRLVAEKT